MQSQAGYAGYGNVSYQNVPRQLDAMDVIGQGFKGFFRNWAPWTGAITVHFIILVVMVGPMLIGGALTAGSASTSSSRAVAMTIMATALTMVPAREWARLQCCQ